MNKWKFRKEIKLHKTETAWYLWQEVTYISLKDLFKSGPTNSWTGLKSNTQTTQFRHYLFPHKSFKKMPFCSTNLKNWREK